MGVAIHIHKYTKNVTVSFIGTSKCVGENNLGISNELTDDSPSDREEIWKS